MMFTEHEIAFRLNEMSKTTDEWQRAMITAELEAGTGWLVTLKNGELTIQLKSGEKVTLIAPK